MRRLPTILAATAAVFGLMQPASASPGPGGWSDLGLKQYAYSYTDGSDLFRVVITIRAYRAVDNARITRIYCKAAMYDESARVLRTQIDSVKCGRRVVGSAPLASSSQTPVNSGGAYRIEADTIPSIGAEEGCGYEILYARVAFSARINSNADDPFTGTGDSYNTGAVFRLTGQPSRC